MRTLKLQAEEEKQKRLKEMMDEKVREAGEGGTK